MIEKRKAIFLDKDGTLIPDVPYNVNPDLITLADGVAEGLQLLKEEGFLFIVISNQAGVARGYFQMEDLKAVERKLDELLTSHAIEIAHYYFCPHHPDGKIPGFSISCDCRKPKPGMILQAIKDFDIDAAKSWMIGDILNDVEAGNRAGCQTVLIDNGNETEWVKNSFRTPTFTARTFLNAAKYIANHSIDPQELNDTKLAAV
jgi:D-glycero-D-manno-heptose 1,7-bisphosphate phosphatase